MLLPVASLRKWIEDHGKKKRSSFAFASDAFLNKIFRDLFVRYNTTMPSSAAVERMFILGKDVSKSKRSRMNDKHDEMLVFCVEKVNKICFVFNATYP